eukprot:gene60884-83273_t
MTSAPNTSAATAPIHAAIAGEALIDLIRRPAGRPRARAAYDSARWHARFCRERSLRGQDSRDRRGGYFTVRDAKNLRLADLLQLRRLESPPAAGRRVAVASAQEPHARAPATRVYQSRGARLCGAPLLAVLDIYDGVARAPFATFRETCLQRVRALIPFDAAIWGSGAEEPQLIFN